MAQDGRMLMLPLVDREIPLVADEWAKPELGSGCVKITPAHDANDYEVGLRSDLPMINILNPDGTLNANAGPYQGLTIAEGARAGRRRSRRTRACWCEIEDREIDLAHSDRSKTPIEPYLADQWFVRMDELAQSAMDAVTDGRVKIIPARYRQRLSRLAGRKTRLARQPAICGGDIRFRSGRKAVHDRRRDRSRTAGADSMHLAVDRGPRSSCSPVETPKPDTIERPLAHDPRLHQDEDPDLRGAELEATRLCPRRGRARHLVQFGALAAFDARLAGENAELDYYYPTSTLITSRDIITLWVARMVLTGLNNMGEVPFREVFIHPKILDGYGETMSKSKGNGVDPLDVIEKFGADALRFGLAYLTTETQDVRMPVQFECPHCDALIDQTKKNRELPRLPCPKCSKEFSTQWADDRAGQSAAARRGGQRTIRAGPQLLQQAVERLAVRADESGRHTSRAGDRRRPGDRRPLDSQPAGDGHASR